MRFLILIGLALTVCVGAQAAPPKACSDHLDNDADGLIDFPADPGCTSKKDNDELNAPPLPAVLRTAVVMVNFTNDQSQPYTVAQARTIAFDAPDSVAAFYLEASYGKQTLAGDVFGWWTVPFPNNPCDTLAWKNSARAMALAQGVNLDTDYDHVALVFPRTSACAFDGRAGSFYNGVFDTHTVAHEVGHSFNLNHANFLGCTQNGVPVTLSATCQEFEYGDMFDAMGSNLRHFNGWAKARIGWLTNCQTITASGQYTISPLPTQPQPNPQLLLIPRPNGSVFALEFRQPTANFERWNTTDWAVTGVMVRIADEMPEVRSQNAHSVLLDAHPIVNNRFDAPFAVGETLVDGGIAITVVSVSPSGAVVDVTLG